MSLILCTIGCSGSGKSHLQVQLQKHFGEKMLNVEPDDIRRQWLGDVSSQEHGRRVFEMAGEQMWDACGEYDIIYFNATNTSWSRTRKFIEQYSIDSDVLYIFMMESQNVELCIERVNSDLDSGKDRAKVPEEAIIRHAKAFNECLSNCTGEKFLYLPNKIKRLIDTIESKLIS